ncbi:MAG: hypothetical protein WKG07_45630 [Hymenobacter sp.]
MPDYRAPATCASSLSTWCARKPKHAKKGLPSGIVMKMNSLEDRELIDEFYKASRGGRAHPVHRAGHLLPAAG